MKKFVQAILRLIHKSILKFNFPDKISIYFHDIYQNELSSIKNIILFFQNLGYEFVSVADFSKDYGLNKKQVALTFDDGFKNWINLMEIFEEHNVKATFFLNSIFLTEENKDRFLKNINLDDESKLINLSDIEKIYNKGHEIGAHTHSHYTISRLSLKDLISEDTKNFDILSQYFNIVSFAIPYGMRRYVTKEQLDYLKTKYKAVCFGESGMQFKQNEKFVQRYPWQSDKSFLYNIENICTDTSYFNDLTLRSGLG